MSDNEDFVSQTKAMIATNGGPVFRKMEEGWVVISADELHVGDMVSVRTRTGYAKSVVIDGFLDPATLTRKIRGGNGLYLSLYHDAPKHSGLTAAEKARRVGRSLGIEGEIWDEDEMDRY